MRKTIRKGANDVYEFLTNALSTGHGTAIPREILEKEGLTIDELSEYYHVKQGPYGLIHFLGIRKAI